MQELTMDEIDEVGGGLSMLVYLIVGVGLLAYASNAY